MLSSSTIPRSLSGRLILQTPGSVLLLKSDSFGEPDFVRFTHNRFHTQGLCTDRLILEPGQPGLSHHLAQYNRVHVALDPLTYNGTTTTCEALWMGVPVVTLAGDCHAARVSTSLLNTVGRPDLVARTEADYISIASGAVAQTVVDRNRVRRALASSTICDAPGFAEDFAALLRTQWRAWCATPP